MRLSPALVTLVPRSISWQHNEFSILAVIIFKFCHAAKPSVTLMQWAWYDCNFWLIALSKHASQQQTLLRERAYCQ